MASLLVSLYLALFAANAHALPFHRCECQLDFQRENGFRYTVYVSTQCPDAESRIDLNCSGRESGRMVTATCSNFRTGQSRSWWSGQQFDARPVTPWPRCMLW